MGVQPSWSEKSEQALEIEPRACEQHYAARKTGPVIRIAIAKTSAENLMAALLAEADRRIKHINWAHEAYMAKSTRQVPIRRA
jgi:hypothetical protein